MPQPKGYSRAQIALHWGIAVLIAGQFVLHEAISGAWDRLQDGAVPGFEPLVAAHVLGGAAVFGLMAWRLALRLRRGAPPPPEAEPAPLRMASHVAHWAFYAIVAGLCISGAVAWFGGVAQAAQGHNALKVALLALIAVHVVAVPFHRFVLKSDVMGRMIRAA